MKKTMSCLFFGILSFSIIGCRQWTSASEVKIVGGVENERIHSETVALTMENSKGGGWCTGTIVRDDLVMTAAHCVADSPAISIYAAPSISHGSEKTAREAKYAIGYLYHPEYDPKLEEGYHNTDLGFVIFPKGTFAGYTIGKIASKSPQAGELVRLVGYGRTNGADATSNPEHKRHTGVSNVQPYMAELDGTILLLSSQVSMSAAGVGPGDSGGALFNGNGEIVGVASAGAVNRPNKLISEKMPYFSLYADINNSKLAPYIRTILSARDLKGNPLGEKKGAASDSQNR